MSFSVVVSWNVGHLVFVLQNHKLILGPVSVFVLKPFLPGVVVHLKGLFLILISVFKFSPTSCLLTI